MNEARVDARCTLVDSSAEIDAVVSRALAATRVAVDVEANGLFAYRARLCTVQLAFENEAGLAEVVVIDTLAAPAARLAPLFSERGPTKVLHDLTFDAKLLEEAGAPLGRVRDTSVAARLLGKKATGLAALVGEELGVTIDKRFQQHDWSKRPLRPEELGYLASDVKHLLALDERLHERARAVDLEAEIEDECAHKLASASLPPRDARPMYARIRGALELDPAGLAVLRRLVAAREDVAERDDVAPFKVVGSEVLLELARRRPTTAAGVSAVRGAAVGRSARHVDDFARAVAEGLADGAVPEAERARCSPPRPDRATVQKRRAFEARITAWRRAEASKRGVDEQAVLPGHCARDVVELALSGATGEPLREAIAAVAGLGARRAARYAEALAAVVTSDAPLTEESATAYSAP